MVLAGHRSPSRTLGWIRPTGQLSVWDVRPGVGGTDPQPDRPGVAAPILGARRVEQLRDNLGATEVTLDEEQRAHLDDVSAPVTPDYPYRVLAEGTAERRRLL